MRVAARVLWRTNRFEILFVVLASVALAIVAAVVTDRLRALAPTADCIHLVGGPVTSADSDTCSGLMDFLALRADFAGWVLSAVAILPVVAGVILGSQLVAREVEHRTAVFAWSIEARRWRWLGDRTAVAALIVGTVGAICAVVSSSLAAARNPGLDVGAGFIDYGLWGPLVLWHGIAALALASLIGAAVARVLPALLLSALASFALLLGATVVAPTMAPTEIIRDVGGSRDMASRYLEDALVDRDGVLVSFAVARAKAPSSLDQPDISDWVYTNYTAVSLVIPGRAMPGVALLEGGILGIAGAGFLIGTFVVVRRRRPY